MVCFQASETAAEAASGVEAPRSDAAIVRRHAAAGQPVAQLLARPGQPRLDRPDRAAQPLGGLLVGQAFQVAEHDRQPEPIGEPAQLLVELGPGLRAVPIAVGSTRRIAMATSAPRRSRGPPPGGVAPRLAATRAAAP